MPAEDVLALPAESHEDRQARRRAQIKKWQEAADAGLVPRWQALRAIWWIRKQILWADFLHWLRRISAK